MSSAQRNNLHTEALLHAIFRRQYGLITRAQWLDLGLSAPALSRATDRDLEGILPAVYRSRVVVPSFHQVALAAVLWGGEDATASHVTAARLYGAEAEHVKPHIWVPPSHTARSRRVVVHRGAVAKRDRWCRDGIWVTSPARTLVDMAGVLDDEAFEALAEDFYHRGLTTPMSVQRCLDLTETRGRKGATQLQRLLDERGNAAAANRKLEVKVARLLRNAGLRPVRQHKVRVNDKSYFLDFAFPAFKVAVEGQGYASHGGRLAHVRDSRRFGDLAGKGWIVVPVTWEEVTQAPDQVVDKIRSALRAAAA